MNLNFYTKTMNLLFPFKKAVALFIACFIFWGSAFSQVGATALNFDGINDYVTIPMLNNNNAGALNISSAITIEAWINPSKSTGTQDVLCKSKNSPNNAYVFPRTSDGWKTIEFLVNINGYGWKVLKVIYGQAKLNQWHHVAASYDGLKMRIFIDGTQAGEYAFAGSITVNNNPLTIGNQPGFNEYYGGSVDEIRVWNRAVIGCEILNNITCQLGGTQNGLVAYYQFNQGLVNATNTGISQLNDSSPSLANGTLMNFGYSGLVSNWTTGSSITGTCAAYTPPVISAGSLRSVVPLGGTISLTASSNVAGSTYAWVGPNGFTSTQQNPFIAGASLAASGTYTVTITGNGCATTASTDITVALMASALNFDGVDDYISVPFTPSVNLKTFTVETWINPTTSITPVQNIVSNASRASNNGFKFPKTNDGWTTFSFELSVDNQWQIVSAPFPASALGQWNHLAATYDGYFIKMYLNGALVAVSEVTGTFTNNTNNLIIGNQDGVAEYFKGSIDELRIWSRAQSQCEIINNMKTCELNGNNNGIAQQTGLSAYYRLNQGLIGVSNATVTTAADSSGHANDGTLYNFNLNGTTSTWVQGKVNGVCDYFPQPLLSVSANGSAFQVGSTVKLFAVNGNGSYSWNGPNSFASIDSTPVIPNVQQIQAGTYTVSTPYTNCVVTASTRFHITTASQIIANGPTNICPSASVTLSTASQGTSYQWYKNDVAIVGETSNQYVASQTGNYTVTITNAADVTVSAPITVTVVPDILAPVPDLATLPALTIYTGATVTAIPTATDNCRGAVNGTANQSLTFNTPGTFTLVWTFNDLNGNTSVQNQQVTVLDNIPPVLTVPSNMSVQAVSGVCSAVANFAATATDNSGLPVNITYSINPGTAFALGVTTVNVTATDASNNSSYGSFIVTVTPAAVAPITGNTTLCVGSTGTLSSATIGGSWSSSNKAAATVDAAGVVTALAAGTANISYTDVCGSSVTAAITVNPLPSVPVVTVADHCGTSTLSTNAAGTLLWSTGANTASVTVSSAGTYSVTQAVGGCTSAAGSGNASPMALPATPVVSVTNDCGKSTLSTNAAGTLLWSTGANTLSITVNGAGTYNVTQTSVNGCTSAAGLGTAAPVAIPSAPAVTVVDNCGSSVLSTNAAGSLLWGTGSAAASITVTTGGTYTVTQTVNGCVSAAGSGTAAPKAIPSTPVVTVADHCGTSTLSTDAAGTLLWNTGANTASVTVSSAGTYSVTQAVGGCTSAAGSGNASPMALPATPVVSVTNDCGTATLSTNATGTLLWSTGENTSSIRVSNAGAYTVTQTINGCTSTAGSGTTAPKAVPATPVITVVNNCGSSTLSTNASGSLLWSNHATTSSVNITASGNYGVTVTNANGCSAASAVTAFSVNTIPVVGAITGATTVTAGSATQLSDGSAGGVWTSSNPAIATVNASGQVTGVTAGSATITYTVTGAGGCSNAVTATVTVNPSCVTPVFTAISNISVNAVSGCAAPVTYTASVTGNPALTYTFSGATTGTGSGSGSGAGFNLGTTIVAITAHNACGTVSTSFSVTVINDAPVTATITPAAADAFCNRLVLTGNANAATYQWVSPNGNNYANTARISLGQGNAEGVYHLYVTGANGCTSGTGADYNYQRQNLVNSYAILAFSKVQLGNNNTVNGGVGVTSPWGYVGLGSYTNITAPGSFVKAVNISIKGLGVNVTNLIHSAATGIALPAMYYNTASTKKLPDASVKERAVTTLNGNYGELTLKKGSITTLKGNIFGSIKVERGAQVIFTSSATVNIGKLEVDKGPRNGYTYIRFSQDTKVLVSSHVSISSNCFVNPDNNSVTFYLGDTSTDDEKFTVKGGDTKVNANIYVPKGAIKVTGGYQYGDYGGGQSDSEEDDDRYYGQGNAMVYMTGFYIADKVSSEGKNVVWNTFDCSAAPVSVINTGTGVQQVTAKTVTSEISVVKASATGEELKVTVMPNPSTTYFTLKFESKYETPVNMRVMDASGRMVEARSKLAANSTVQVGGNYHAGTYFAEILQGSQHKTVQLIKLK